MSGDNYLPDAKSSGLTEDEKFNYESSRTDSGFISSGNINSCEIDSGEIKIDHPQVDSGVIGDQENMRLDSGISSCLDKFTNLSLRTGLNDLGKEESKTATKQDQQQQQTSWEIFYEQDEDGDTHLHMAILQCFPEVVIALIRAAPSPRLLDTQNDDGQSPLHLAAATGQGRIVRWLIVAGARPAPRNRCGDSPLHIAARNGDLLSCKAIMDPIQQQERDSLNLSYNPTPYERCDYNQWNYEGQTCVHVAAINGHIDVLRHLVWYGADINAREGRGGYTALHYAIEKGDERLIKFLLDECKKLNVEVTTYGGRSALQLGYPVAKAMFETLLACGVPSPYTSEDEEDSDEEKMYDEPVNKFSQNLIINASA